MRFFIPSLAILTIGLVLALGTYFSSPAAFAARPKSVGASGLAPLYTEEIQHWGPFIQSWASEYALDPNLVATVMQIESCGDPQAGSQSGATGLFQVMPFHFKSGEDPFDPETNARRGLNYLRRSFEKAGGDARLALAGYNGGIGLIQADSATWPVETRRYAAWGAAIYADARQGVAESQTLQDWLGNGGSRLCRQAARRLGLTN
ncbi:MAG TPA: transglycosylase SLT domain-containing protein [Anaerolineaceae bacterium]|nr:transglycosylase SLT domain-containing protein [Anaerolineaceae bacterium]